MIKLTRLFNECLNAPYIHVENSGDYWLKARGNTLYIYLESSNGAVDWKNNLDFLPAAHKNIWTNVFCNFDVLRKNCALPSEPYENMELRWLAHRGFLRVWNSIEPHIAGDICSARYRKIIIVGYSHGAALAVLCHEYVWFHRSDIRDKIEGYGFGCPRVFWGIQTKEIKRRFERFTVIRNLNDIVTHVPPNWLGFSHVGKILSIGQKGKYSRIDAHRPENILTELKIWELSGGS